MRRLIQISETISGVSGQLSGYLIFILMVMILVEVLTRYLLRSPLAVADEFGGYILVAVTYIGLAYTWRIGGHVRIVFLFNKFSPGFRKKLRVGILLLAAVFTLVIIKATYELLSFSYQLGTRSGSWLRIPILWPQLVLMIGPVLLLIQLIGEVMKSVGGFETKELIGNGG